MGFDEVRFGLGRDYLVVWICAFAGEGGEGDMRVMHGVEFLCWLGSWLDGSGLLFKYFPRRESMISVRMAVARPVVL
jgi:hypothetical protein